MSVAKELRFPVTVALDGEGPRVRTSVAGKHDLLVATPPEFAGGLPGYWSPEDLFVGAVATCYAVTLKAVARRRAVPIHRLDIRAIGHVGTPAEGDGIRFTLIELAVAVETDAAAVEALEAAAARAEKACLVARSLDTPVRVAVTVAAGVRKGVLAA